MVVASQTRTASSGLVVWHNQQPLPAKEVVRVAYRLANNLPPSQEVRFSSGDATIRLLESLGFQAERIGERRTSGKAAED